MNSFDQIRIFSEEKFDTHRHSVSFTDYQQFCKTYLFANLRDEKFGEAFCKKFKITDTLLSLLSNESNAKARIDSMEYIR